MRILNKRLMRSYLLTLACPVFVVVAMFAEPALAQPCSPHWVAGPGVPGTDVLIYGLGNIPGGDIFVSGAFDTAGGVASPNLARYSPSTNTWSAVGSDANAWEFVTLPNGDVIAVGNFTNIAGVPANYVARYSTSTNTWSPLGVGTNSSVAAITALPGGDVVMGGWFSMAGGAPFSRIARFNPVTGTWSALGSGILGAIDAQALVPDGDLFVGGQMGGVGNISRYNFATNTWSALGSGANGQVTALAVIPGGDLIVGGAFSVAGGISRRAVARYRPATNAWSTLGTGLLGGTPGSPLAVHSLLTLPSGDVLVGGSFNSAGGMPASNIALYHPTLNTWSALGAGLTSDASIVSGVLQLPGGDVIVAGQFNQAGGAAANNIARYSFGAPSGMGDGNADGAIDGLDVQGLASSLIMGGPVSDDYCAYDMNHDGFVNDADLALFVNALIPS